MPDRPARAGEAHFEAFVREFQDLVFGTALRLLGNPTEAEDVAQTVFLKAFERFDEVSRSAAAPGWLKTVARNLALNHLTRYRRRWQFFSELDGDPDGGHSSAFEEQLPSPPDEDRPECAAAALEAALQALPDHQRVPIVLFHFDDMSYQAIADVLGVSLGKVKTDIHRGRQALRSALTAGHAK